jgi:integrase
MDGRKSFPGVRATRSGKVEIKFDVRGKTYWETLDLSPTPRNLAAASRIRAEKKARVKAGLPLHDEVQDNPPVTQVAQAYLDECRRTLTKSTCDSYRDILNIYWLPAIGEFPVGEIRYAHLRDVDAAIDWPSDKTRKNALIPLSGIFKYAWHGDLIDHNPVKFPSPKIPKKETQAYTREERDELLKWLKANAPAMPYMYFRTAFGTGMRTGELLALHWSKYDGEGFEVDEAIVRHELKDTKTHRARYVPLPKALNTELKEFKTRWEKGFVFLNQYGRPYARGDKLNVWFQKAIKETAVPQLGGRNNPYPWRHTFISIAVDEDVPVTLLADVTGHSVEMLLKVYRAKTRRADLMDQMEKINDL